MFGCSVSQVTSVQKLCATSIKQIAHRHSSKLNVPYAGQNRVGKGMSLRFSARQIGLFPGAGKEYEPIFSYLARTYCHYCTALAVQPQNTCVGVTKILAPKASLLGLGAW